MARARLIALVVLAAVLSWVAVVLLSRRDEPGPDVEPARDWDPPPDLAHIESTPPELRQQIDEHIDTMMSTWDHHVALDAKDALIAIGKPAFPRVLGTMARVRDRIPEDGTVTDPKDPFLGNRIRNADEILRELDGYLNAHGIYALRRGHARAYLGEHHLREVLRRYLEYYNQSRCHLSLEGNAPEPREVEAGSAPVRAIAHLGGLHHRYTRAV